ncbi:MAG: pantoate--beta-alanine ligase [Spirochaetia bacterium]|jgi:pantoate--beta-alanine ligase|nr:pantoate--beta-alanine ligase [Spirochaetia bacterium]
MEVVKSVQELRQRVAAAKKEGKLVGFVPTMGYLHNGHLSLVEESRKFSDYQVMSIFVNRMQFNDAADFENYPVDTEMDSRLAERAGVDLLFMPPESEVYNNRKTYIDIESLADKLCGEYRPGHFRGALTVVAKLFNMVQPDVSVFGQKDIQQAVCIQKMVDDLNFPIKIIIAPIVREADGLAMSSRNKHLSEDEKKRAVSLYSSLKQAKKMLQEGERSWDAIQSQMESVIMNTSPKAIDYISLVKRDDLQLINFATGRCVIALAVFFGTTRLIDNMIVEINGESVSCSL